MSNSLSLTRNKKKYILFFFLKQNKTKQRRWMKYWISFAVFQTAEPLADVTIIFITPFYYLLKILLITWLVYGTKIIYDSIIDRELKKREKSIDRWLTKTYKLRDEFIALIWFELSRCSMRIITALMSGGLSVLVKSHPEHSETNCYETSPQSIENIHNTISNYINGNTTNNNHINQNNSNNNNNNEITYRRSKRIIKIEEVGNEEHEAMDTDSDDARSNGPQEDITVEYIITQEG